MGYKFHEGDVIRVIDTTAGSGDMDPLWHGICGEVMTVDHGEYPDGDYVYFIKMENGVSWWCCEDAIDYLPIVVASIDDLI